MPPIAGLQLIAPTVSMPWVSNNDAALRRGRRASGLGAGMPPPMTMTSKV